MTAGGGAGIEDLPPPPYVMGNSRYLNVIGKFDEKTALALLAGTGLEPARSLTGGMHVLDCPDVPRIGPVRLSQFWLHVAGHDGPDGIPARTIVAGAYTEPYDRIMRGFYRAPIGMGESSIVLGDVDAVATGQVGDARFRMVNRRTGAEPAWKSSFHYYVTATPGGGRLMWHLGWSTFEYPVNPVCLDVEAPVGSKLAALSTARLIDARRNLIHCTIGVPFEEAPASWLSTDPDLIHLLSKIDRGAILLDRQFEIIFANKDCEVLLGDLMLPGGNGKLSRRASPPLDRLLTDVVTEARGANRPVALRRQDGRHPILLFGVPLGSEKTDASSPRSGATLVLLTDLEGPQANDTAASLQLLGLTPAEARAAALVGSGLTPKEVARILGNSDGTVRIHLQRVYEKLDISRQTQLAALVERLGRLGL